MTAAQADFAVTREGPNLKLSECDIIMIREERGSRGEAGTFAGGGEGRACKLKSDTNLSGRSLCSCCRD
jgi:hypothetical protein